MSESLIKVENVSKKFCRDLKRSLWYGMKDLGSELLGQLHNGGGQLREDVSRSESREKQQQP